MPNAAQLQEGADLHLIIDLYICGRLSYPEACKQLADKGVEKPAAMIAAIFEDDEEGSV